MYDLDEARAGRDGVMNVSIDAHPLDQAVIVRYQINSSNQTEESVENRQNTYQKVINLKDFNDKVDIAALANLIIEKCAVIPPTSHQELEQVLYYLQKRQNQTNGRSRSASSTSSDRPTSAVRADIEKVEEYIESLYEEGGEKNKGALCVLELTKNPTNLPVLIENEILIGALARVFREDWKKNFDLATNIIRIFANFSFYEQFQSTLSHHKIGVLTMQAVEYELKRCELWSQELRKADEAHAKKIKITLRKQAILLTGCITLLTNLASDLSVELKMIRKELVVLLIKCLAISNENSSLALASVQFLLKLSIFEENKLIMEQNNLLDRLLRLFPISDMQLRKTTIKLLFNLSFDPKLRTKMVSGGLVTHVAGLIQNDQKALNLLYQLSINDDAKAMLTFTDAIQLLMRDLLSGNASDVTKAVLLNACVEKRNSQLVCGNNGQGLDLLMDAIFEGKDLLIAKIVRTIAAHDGPTQEMFLKWMDKFVSLGMKCSTESAEDQAALGLECIAAAAQIKIADWTKLNNTHHLAKWMHETLMKNSRDLHPLHLQIVIMCGTMAPQLDSAKALTRLLETFLQLLHNMQEDDEFVCQLLYLFIQLLRHKELSDILMGDNSILGAYVIDLMHDKNTAIREMCDHALTIIGEHSQEWARKIAAERFRWHNGQWLEMVEMGGASGASGMSDEQQPEDDYEADVLFDDDFNDGFEQNDNDNDEVALF